MDDHSEPKITTHRSFAALLLIAVGALILLDNLRLLPFAHLRDYWPLALSAYGLAILTYPRSRFRSLAVWPVALIVCGVLLTLGNLGMLHVTIRSLWPIFLIAAGLSMLFRGRDAGSAAAWARHRANRRLGRRMNFGPIGASVGGGFQGTLLHEDAIFSTINRRVDSPAFEGATLNSTFGELKVDLRATAISTPDHRAVAEANAAFGAIKIRVPETWKVILQGTAVFGAYEDRTVPPRPVPGVDTPTLIVRGNAAFGAVEIEN